jgi:hypothetical protein
MSGSASDVAELESERAFERVLLDSARSDDPPASRTDEAWRHFSLAGGAIAAATAAGTGRVGLSTPLAAPGRAALRFGALGALGGGALVAAWFVVVAPRLPSQSALSPPAATVPARAAPATNPESSPQTSLPVHAATPPATPAPVERTAGGGSARAGTGQPAAKRLAGAAPAAAANSGLGAEIALLDAARTAIGIGAYDRALALIERHRHEHARGMLRRDAEVLFLEALFERGSRTEAGLRAQSFLERFPDDPQSARVRAIAAAARASDATAAP